MTFTLDELNAAPAQQLRPKLRSCCAAASWVDHVVAGRPYQDEAALHSASDDAIDALDDAGLAEALAGHPRIGERATAAHSGWSRQEQAGASAADDDVRAQLAEANAAYEARFGQVYLVCATGKSATELLAICRSRLGNDPSVEQDVVRGELAKINRLRLAKLLHEES
jgi:2-oxo-4-hydroxy-4-carboxy-5-ureidoimidazoline decarboxylase